MRNLTTCVLFIIFLFSFANAGEISLSQSLNKTEILYNDSVSFEIILQWDGPQHAYVFNKPLSPYFDRVRVSGFTSSIKSALSNGQEITTKKFNYVLVPTSSGMGKIDPINVSYISWPDSLPGELVTEAMTFKIADPIRVDKEEGAFSNWLLIMGMLVILGAVIGVWKYKRNKQPEIPQQDPRDKFLEGLVNIKQDSGSDFKKFQTGLYEIMVNFLEEKYIINPENISDEEMFQKLKENNLSEEKCNKINSWFQEAQKDKFRPVSNTPGNIIRLEAEIRDFFEKL
ncbi:MAG: BatD family protein [Candidatus Zixiibacteriota bacterium]